MAQEFMTIVNELRRKDKGDITEEEMAFLQARRSYLTVDERIYFGITEPEQVEEAEAAEEEKPAKKKK